ncbi:hypothetical protein SNE40_003625 [Patella caerulea]|uniref:Uncharacterized protein n=1 Tax=Patella caerulea TaxID=87958 RepID=A0AAN8K3D3_PATCE
MEIDMDDEVRDPDWIPEDRDSSTDEKTGVFGPETVCAPVQGKGGINESPRKKGVDKRMERILQPVDGMGDTIRVKREEIIQGMVFAKSLRERDIEREKLQNTARKITPLK